MIKQLNRCVVETHVLQKVLCKRLDGLISRCGPTPPVLPSFRENPKTCENQKPDDFELGIFKPDMPH
ncbi:unnamed protein product [Cercopithifilaria johnstoni]|uniref:Uncharacterized protein n=1 Tax=Cercopithifilaria johnstoni TaxID=2874296 RepID=A0A8J2LQ96_9BILA|nr:unnamed protein product [Cercopithifilaria johnstoni]